MLPAVLLLLSERPGHGYSLHKGLQQFQFDAIDRPTIYRALARLESDALVESWTEAPKAGQTRRVYGITALGEKVLGIWMNVIREECDCLGLVLRRYHATGTAASILDEVERDWAAALDYGWSPLVPQTSDQTSDETSHLTTGRSSSPVPLGTETAEFRRSGTREVFRLVPERSVLMVDVRSTAGPISFGAKGLTGFIEADVVGDAVLSDPQPTAHIDIAVSGLRSGNSVYDAELLRRIHMRRFPVVGLDLRESVASPGTGRYRLAGELTFHGVTRPVDGSVRIEVEPGRLIVSGEQAFDVRDFGLTCPSMLMLRFYPDVRVRLQVEAELSAP